MKAVEPPNADTEASCFRDTGCTQQIEFQSIRDCCVNDPIGASFNIPGTEICSICVGKDNIITLYICLIK